MEVDEGTDSDTEVSDDNGEPTFSGDAKEEEEEEHDPSHKNIRLAKSVSGRVKGVRGRNERVMPPEECRAHLRRLFINEEVMCSLLFGRHGPLAPVTNRGYSKASADMFFLDCLLVSPTRFRPPASVGDSLFEHSQNELLAKVLNTSYLLRDLNNELRQLTDKDSGANDATVNKVTGRLLDALVQLQVDVNSFMDSSKNPTRVRQGKLPPAGVKQGLEKKEGLFRMHMMVFWSSFGCEVLVNSHPLFNQPGKTSQLCRTFSHFPRCEYRNKRNWHPTRLRDEADLPRARERP